MSGINKNATIVYHFPFPRNVIFTRYCINFSSNACNSSGFKSFKYSTYKFLAQYFQCIRYQGITAPILLIYQVLNIFCFHISNVSGIIKDIYHLWGVEKCPRCSKCKRYQKVSAPMFPICQVLCNCSHIYNMSGIKCIMPPGETVIKKW